MKFGKRRQDADAPEAQDASVSDADSASPPATDGWSVPAAEHPPAAETPATADEPFFHEAQAAGDEQVYHQEPVVEGEAVELPADTPPAPMFEPPAVRPAFDPPVPLTVQQPQPEVPLPQAEQPVTVITPGPGPDPVTTLGDSGEAFASGHAAAPGPSWQEPVMELANERPELVVAAAFAGGVLAALILRRLGN